MTHHYTRRDAAADPRTGTAVRVPARRLGGAATAALALFGIAGLATGVAIAASDAPPASPPAGEHRHHGGPGLHGDGMDMMIPGLPHPGMLEHMADELQLTTEQRQTIRGLFENARPQIQALREKLRAAARTVMETTPDDRNYASVVQSGSQQIGDLTAQLVQQGSQVRTQVYAVLTPEQKTKLKALHAEMQQKMEARRAQWAARRKDGPPPPDAPEPPPAR